ncbi:MAG: hypothetical protein ACJAZ9_002008 [Neolewinella sp.]|jgi:hypothetical protein
MRKAVVVLFCLQIRLSCGDFLNISRISRRVVLLEEEGLDAKATEEE